MSKRVPRTGAGVQLHHASVKMEEAVIPQEYSVSDHEWNGYV